RCHVVIVYMLTSLLIAAICRSSLFSFFFFSMILPPSRPTLFPYTTLFRSQCHQLQPRASKFGQGFWENQDMNPRFIYFLDQESRSEEHTSELQSRFDLVCRLLLEKKKNRMITN